jgi:2,3-bisphosphoglycerate-independent phosphoglycerate mutase
MAVETVDLCIGRLIRSIKKAGGILLITADHGNADEMFEVEKKTGKIKTDQRGKPKAKTAHTLNPVWFIIYDPSGDKSIRFNPDIRDPRLTNIAATCFQLLGLESPDLYDPPLLIFD